MQVRILFTKHFVFVFLLIFFTFMKQSTFATNLFMCPTWFTFVDSRIVNNEVRITCSATIKTCFYNKKQIGFRYKQGTKRSACIPLKKNGFTLSEQDIKKLRHFQKGVRVTFTKVQKINTDNNSTFSQQKIDQNNSSSQEWQCVNYEQTNTYNNITNSGVWQNFSPTNTTSGDNTLVSQTPWETQSENLSSFALSFVRAHNLVRATVGVPEVRRSTTVAQSAQVWADTLQREWCSMRHSSPAQRNNYGENLYWFSNSYGALPTPEEVVWAWASEREWYNYQTNTCNPPTSKDSCWHYTQIVRRNTTEIGCWYAVCRTQNGWFTMTTSIRVCQYNPAGNRIGQKPY